MPSKQQMKLKSGVHNSNINKRGSVEKSLVKKEDKFPVGPLLLGVFLFVVVGSVLFQVLGMIQGQGEM